MARYKVPSQAASGADSFSDQLVGNQFTTDSSLMTSANFAVEKAIPEKDSKNFITQPFSAFLTLDDIQEETAKTTDGSTVTRDEGKIEFNNDKEYADRSLYGSLKQRIGVTITNIVSKYPAAILVDSSSPVGSSRLTAEQITYDPILNTTQFKIQFSFLYNPFDIVLSEPESIVIPQTNNTIRNFYSSYTKYVIELSGETYNIISYSEPDTNNKIVIKVAGRCFAGYIGYYQNYLIRPNDGVVENFYAELDDLERVLLNRETYPIFNAGFNVPRDTNGGSVTDIRTEYVNWPLSKDGWNIQIVGLDFDYYVNKISTFAEEIDEYKSNLVIRFLTSPQLYEFDTEEKKIEAIFQIYGQSFDKVKKFIDNIAYMRNVSYDGINNVPNVLLKNLSETLGFTTVDLFDERNLQDSLYTRHSSQYDGVPTGMNLIESEVEFYRRILVNLAWLYKSKGTRKAIEFFLRFIGAPEPMIRLDEYVYNVDEPLSSKTVEDDIRDAIQGTKITNVAEYDETISGYTITQLTGSTSLSRSQYPVYEDTGLPRGMEFPDASMFFAKGAGWYRRTLDHRSSDILDTANSDLTSKVKVIKTMAKPFTYGEDYFNTFRQLPGLDYGYSLSSAINNRKTEVIVNLSESQLILNRKNINVFISSDRAIDYDIYSKSRDLSLTFTGSTGAVTPQTGITFAEFLDNVLSEVINDSHVIKYKAKYITLLQIYNNYQESVGFTPYSYITINDFVNRLSPYWTNIVDQFIPATTQWTGGNLIENGVFNRSKFKFRQPCVPMIYRETLYPNFNTIITEDLETLIGGGSINGEDQSDNFRGLQLFGGVIYDVNLNLNGVIYNIGTENLRPFSGFNSTADCTILTDTTDSIPLICDYTGSTLFVGGDTVDNIKSEWRTTLDNLIEYINSISTGETGFTISAEYYIENQEEKVKFTVSPNSYYGCTGYEMLDYYFMSSYGISSGCTLEVGVVADGNIIYTGLSACQLTANLHLNVYGVGDENGQGPFYVRTGCTENVNTPPITYDGNCVYTIPNVLETSNFDLIVTDASNCEQKMSFKGLQLAVIEPPLYPSSSGITGYPIIEYKPSYNHGIQVGTKVYSGDTSVILTDPSSYQELSSLMSAGRVVEIDANDITVGSSILCVELKPYNEMTSSQFSDASISGYSFAFNYKFITVTGVDCLTTTKISIIDNTYQVLPTSKLLVYTNLDLNLNVAPYHFDYKYPEDLEPGDLLIDYSGFTHVFSGASLNICSTDNYKTYYKQINFSNSNGTNIVVNGDVNNKIIVSYTEELIEPINFDLRQYFIGLGIDESSLINTAYYRDFSIVSGYSANCGTGTLPSPTPTPSVSSTPGASITPTRSITPTISVSSSIPSTPSVTPSTSTCPVEDPFGTGLQACWNFEEASGSTIYDYTENNHDLNPQGTIYYQEPGKVDSYAVGIFDKYSRLTGDTGLNLTKLTISVWFKTSGTTTEHSNRYIFTRQSSLYGGYSVILSYNIAGNGVVFMTNNQYYGDGHGPVKGSDDGNWHHFVVTYDNNTGIAHEYFDGVYYGTYQHATFISNTSLDSHITVGNIDSSYHVAYDSPFNGWIDGLGIWDRELDYCEVMTLWNTGSGRTCSYSPLGPTPSISVSPSVTPTTGLSQTPTPTITPTRTITPTMTPTTTPTPSITPSAQDPSSIYFDRITNGTMGVLGVNYPAGRTFSITFYYKIEATVDNTWSNGVDPVDAATYVYVSIDSGNTWTEVDYVTAEIPGYGPPEETNTQVKYGSYTVNGITDVNALWVNGSWDCAWTQDTQYGTVEITITGATVDSGPVNVICNNKIVMGCLQTTALTCGPGVTITPTPTVSRTPSITQSIGASQTPTPTVSRTPSITQSIGASQTPTPSTTPLPTYIGFDTAGNISFTGLGINTISLQIRATAEACQTWACDYPPEAYADYEFRLAGQILHGTIYENSASSTNMNVCSQDEQIHTFIDITSGSTIYLDVNVNDESVYCGHGWGTLTLELVDLTITSGSSYIAIDPARDIYIYSESTPEPTPSPTPTISLSRTVTPSRSVSSSPSRTPSLSRTPSKTPSVTPVAIFVNITNNSQDNTIENVTIDGADVWDVNPAFPYYPSDNGTARSPKVAGTYSVGVYLGGSGNAKYATLTDSDGIVRCVNINAGTTYFAFTSVVTNTSQPISLVLYNSGSCPSPTPSITVSRTKTPTVTPSLSISSSPGTSPSRTPTRTPSKTPVGVYGYNVNLYSCDGITCGDYLGGSLVQLYSSLSTGSWYKLDTGYVMYVLSTGVTGGDDVNVIGGPYGSCNTACGSMS